MLRIGLITAIIVGTLSISPGAVRAQEGLSLIDTVMGQIGRTASDIRFDQDEMAGWGGDRFRLKHFSLFHKHPTKLPGHSRLILDQLTESQSSLSGLLAQAARLADHSIRRGLIGDQLQPYLVYPDSVARPSITRSRNILPGLKFNGLKDRIDLIYRMTQDDKFSFTKALAEADKNKYRKQLYELFLFGKEEHSDLVYELADKVDLARMLAGAQDFAEAINRITDSADNLVFPDWVVEFETRSGLVVIGTVGDDVYKYATPPLLIVDGGGNDTYDIAGFPEEYPLSIIVDFSGNDTYKSTDSTTPGIGGAVLGMAAVVDLEGDDRYETTNLSLGAGLFGVGLAYDRQGNDVYISRNFSQGAGSFGTGMLIDSAGNDSMYCFTTSQGYGYTAGAGILFDHSGDDVYIAEDDSLFNPSPQTAEHNSSLAQGVGFGKRADYIDGHSWAGGVGILCDGSGDDSYSAGLFAQGCGYWYAVGMLIDGDGADQYDGVWYVQGAAAHFAVGFLDDFSGNDRYYASNNMAQGAGHDFSIGYLHERSGDDSYRSPNLSLGAGNANGIGIFFDHQGNDSYRTSSGTTLGKANGQPKGLRKLLEVFGVFVDGGGIDEYAEPHAGNNRRWVFPERVGENFNSTVIGVGLDYDSESEDKTGQD